MMGNDTNDQIPSSGQLPPNYQEVRVGTALPPTGAATVLVQAQQPAPNQHQQQPCTVSVPVAFGHGAPATIVATDGGYAYNARSQQVVPLLGPATFVNLNGTQYVAAPSNEPSEAAVARPLSIISLFCFLQICFAIPAIVLACKRNKPKKVYKTSIALSLTAIVVGMVMMLVLLAFGMVLPFRSYGYYYSDYYGYRNGYYNDEYYDTTPYYNNLYFSTPNNYYIGGPYYPSSTAGVYYYPWTNWMSTTYSYYYGGSSSTTAAAAPSSSTTKTL